MAGTPQTGSDDRGGDRRDPATEAFLAHRNLLFTVAYEMLGSAADAEDVLQETWLRWAGVDLASVRDQRAYLVRITTRQALTRLRTLGRRREFYVGTWLPEPLLTAPDVADDVEPGRRRRGQAGRAGTRRGGGQRRPPARRGTAQDRRRGVGDAVRNPAKLSHMEQENALRL